MSMTPAFPSQDPLLHLSLTYIFPIVWYFTQYNPNRMVFIPIIIHIFPIVWYFTQLYNPNWVISHVVPCQQSDSSLYIIRGPSHMMSYVHPSHLAWWAFDMKETGGNSCLCWSCSCFFCFFPKAFSARVLWLFMMFDVKVCQSFKSPGWWQIC